MKDSHNLCVRIDGLQPKMSAVIIKLHECSFDYIGTFVGENCFYLSKSYHS